MLFNLENWENIIHFGNLFASIGKKTYFLALGTIPVTGVGFVGRKITGSNQKHLRLEKVSMGHECSRLLFLY